MAQCNKGFMTEKKRLELALNNKCVICKKTVTKSNFFYGSDGDKVCLNCTKEYVEKDMVYEYPKFFKNDPIEIKHADLQKVSENSWFKKKCPKCDTGTLMVIRDKSNGYVLSELDRCISCGQQFKYTDIEEMRKNDPFFLFKKKGANK